MSLKLFIHPEQLDDPLEISHLLRFKTCELSEILYNDNFHSVRNIFSCHLNHDEQFFTLVLASQTEVLAWVEDENSNRVFTGVIEPTFDSNISQFLEGMRIEIGDLTYLLDKKFDGYLQIPQLVDGISQPIFVRSNPNSILYQILNRANLSHLISSDAPDIPSVVQQISLSDDQEYREIIDELLYEHNHVLICLPDGSFSWFKYGENTFTPTMTIDREKSTAEPFVIRKVFNKQDGFELTWSLPELIPQVRLWDANLPISPDGIFTGVDIAPGDYWPKDGEIREIFQDYIERWLDIPYTQGTNRLENRDISLIATSNQTLSWSGEPGIQILEESYEAFRAKILFRNTSSEIKRLFFVAIYGDALIRTGVAKELVPTNSKNPLPYTSRYVFEQSQAESLATVGARGVLYSDFEYEFYLNSLVPIGTVVRLKQDSTPIDTSAIVVETRILWDRPTPLIFHKAHGLSEFDSLDSNSTIMFPFKTELKNQQNEARLDNQITPTDIANGIEGAGLTKLPVDLTPTATSLFRGILIKWNKQTNLGTAFLQYELQVTDDPINGPWYSPRTDFGDWRGTEGESLITPIEVFTHVFFNGGTEEDPEPLTLTYRVRQRTKEGLTSNWATIQGTASLLDTGDIAQNSIGANKLKVGILNAILGSFEQQLIIGDDGLSATSEDETWRLLLQGNKISFQQKIDAVWTDASWIGDRQGGFQSVFAFLKGVVAPEFNFADVDIGIRTPVGSRIYDFNNTLFDKNGVLGFTANNTTFSTTRKNGSHSLTNNSGNDGSITNITANNSLDTEQDFNINFWTKTDLTTLPIEPVKAKLTITPTDVDYSINLPHGKTFHISDNSLPRVDEIQKKYLFYTDDYYKIDTKTSVLGTTDTPKYSISKKGNILLFRNILAGSVLLSVDNGETWTTPSNIDAGSASTTIIITNTNVREQEFIKFNKNNDNLLVTNTALTIRFYSNIYASAQSLPRISNTVTINNAHFATFDDNNLVIVAGNFQLSFPSRYRTAIYLWDPTTSSEILRFFHSGGESRNLAGSSFIWAIPYDGDLYIMRNTPTPLEIFRVDNYAGVTDSSILSGTALATFSETIIYFFVENGVFFAGSRTAPNIYVSYNNCVSFTQRTVPFVGSQTIISMKFDGDELYVANEDGEVFFSTDEGQNWYQKNTTLLETRGNLKAFLTDNNDYYFVTEDTIEASIKNIFPLPANHDVVMFNQSIVDNSSGLEFTSDFPEVFSTSIDDYTRENFDEVTGFELLADNFGEVNFDTTLEDIDISITEQGVSENIINPNELITLPNNSTIRYLHNVVGNEGWSLGIFAHNPTTTSFEYKGRSVASEFWDFLSIFKTDNTQNFMFRNNLISFSSTIGSNNSFTINLLDTLKTKIDELLVYQGVLDNQKIQEYKSSGAPWSNGIDYVNDMIIAPKSGGILHLVGDTSITGDLSVNTEGTVNISGDTNIEGDLSVNNFPTQGLGIVESGSNANGNYVRFESGLQICYMRRIRGNINEQINFPISFLNDNVSVTLTAFYESGGSATGAIYSSAGLTNTKFHVSPYRGVSHTDGIFFSYQAIGVWK